MKNKYESIALAPGIQVTGLWQMQVIAREWLDQPLIVDFLTGKVITAATLVAGKSWLTLDLIPLSYDFEEKPKTVKGNSYYEITGSGVINNCTATVKRVLESLRFHDLVVILTDKQKRKRIIGDLDAGMTIKSALKIKTSPSGEESIPIELTMDAEDPAPFYDV